MIWKAKTARAHHLNALIPSMCESFPVFTRVVHIDILAMLKTGHNQNLKDCPYGSGQPDDLLVLATVYEVVNSLPEKA